MPKEEGTPISFSLLVHNSLATFPVYARNYLRIQTKKGNLIPFEINEIQQLLEEVFDDIQRKKRLLRVVILKSRRKGISTWVSGRFYYRTATYPNRYAMIVTHEPEATDFIFKMHKRFQEHLPEALRPDERYNNRRVLEFNNEGGTGLDSAIRVGTAGKEDFGSAQLIHYLHLSELAKYPRHLCTNLLLSLLQCVPDIPDSAVIIESTGKGVGGEFYDRFYSSRYLYELYINENGRVAWKESINEKAPPENEYTSIFIPWFVFDEYRMQVRPGFERSLDEQMLVETHGITDEQLQWRRYCIENKCHRDVNLFNQEYPTTARDAFLSSNDSVFDLLKLDALLKIVKPPKSRYDIQFPMGNMVFSENGKLKVWNEPKYGFDYVMSVDVAEGLGGGDYSSIDIINVRTGLQDAQWHGHIAPDLLGVVAYFLGSRYNTALAVVERNQSGISTIDKLLDLKYTNVYVERIIDPPHRPRKRYGWITTKTSKPRIINNLLAELRDNTHGIQCKETFEEMMMYKQFEDGSTGAEQGCFDDRVLSIAIGKYIASTKLKAIVSNPLMRYNQVMKQQSVPRPSPRAWT